MFENNNLFFQLTKNLSNLKKPFILIPNDETYSYEDMINISGSYANALSSLGIQNGDRILVKSEKKIECIWLYLACLRVGVIYVSINPSYTVPEIEYFLKDSEPKLFIITDSNDNFELIDLVESKYKCVTKDLQNFGVNSLSVIASRQKCDFQTRFCNGEELAAILYTSGTTGKSKGAMISHKNLFSNARTLSAIWKVSSADVLLHILPIYHTHGLFVAFNSIMYGGGSVLFHPNFSVEETIVALPKVTMLMGVPTHYIRLVTNKSFSQKVTRNVRLFISGSAPLSNEIYLQFKKITDHSILERYGMTETNMITSNPYENERRAGTVGFPLPGVTVRIRDTKTGTLTANGSIGSIEVKGPNVFSGYWKMPARNKIDFQSDGFFVTGDLGFFDTDGYLTISGRDKDLIISGGLNVYPAEVERVIDSLPEVKESALVGLPHPDFGEGVTAVVTLYDSTEGFIEDSLKKQIRKHLAPFKVPLKIIVKNDLPKNAMGKIQKNLLRNELKGTYFK